ncbi:two-component regulator propeller domain-containing protein [Danxiaibacter flavus]|uniref:histidine kinase n=1 Tax=Danxiaibacter flavus TaxID=3049108 RepID=A0ABV3ZG16_9BACT|nr:two-component regulator propeller domain-containing protein [Chitinophagaceae bacterium DXS]
MTPKLIRKKLHRALLLILCICAAFVSHGQQNDYPFSQLSVFDGLSQNQVNCTYKDPRGFLWFGTLSGLSRYDGYTFKIFRHNSQDSLSLIDDYILRITEAPANRMFILTRNGYSIYDPAKEQFLNGSSFLQSLGLPAYNLTTIIKTNGDFWFVYANDGVFRYSAGKISKVTHIDSDAFSPDASPITDAQKDSHGNIVLIHTNGLLEKLDNHSLRISFRTTALSKFVGTKTYTYNLFVDNKDDAWLYIPTSALGVFYYPVFAAEARQLTKENGLLNNNIISSVIQDNNGKIWIGTDHGGVNIINKNNFQLTVLTSKEENNKTLAENSIYSLYKDDLGIIWVGTYKKGISYYTENKAKFALYKHNPYDAASLPFDDVNRFAEDSNGNLWIGTNGGGLIYFNRKNNTYTRYRHQPNNKNSIGNDIIVSLWIDHKQRVWIGSYYGGLDCFDGNKFIHYKHNEKDSTTIADDRIWDIFEDSSNTLWIGTLGNGFDKFDESKKVFYHHKAVLAGSNFVSSITEDGAGNIWVGTAYGVDVLDKKTGKIAHYSSAANKLSNDNVTFVRKDLKGNMWVGTRDGLNVFNPSKQTFQSFTTKDGLPDNNVLTLLQDSTHNFWVSTPTGISKIAATEKNGLFTLVCKNYDEKDGLQSRIFNNNAAFKTREEELMFGGPNGFNIIQPASISRNTNKPSIVLTGFQLFNESVRVGEKFNKHIILSNAIAETNEIELKYNENVFSIDFAALSYVNADKNTYAYKLDGFNSEWLTTDGKTRRATYTNLDPGEYTFQVKAANDDGVWNDQGLKLKIKILPPFWKTPLAYLLYFIIAVTIFWFARRLDMQRAKMRFELQQQKKEAQRLHELDMMKIKFFTNVSHEFRTPLSLILTPLEKIINQSSSDDQRKQFQLIHRNARRVLNLVNQLLDFRKMEVHELKLHATKGDLAKFIREVSYSFTDLAENKNIQFSYTSNCNHLNTSFDHDKIERILFNLLSNAFKFTPERGKVQVEVNVNHTGKEALAEIKISDTGIGIAPEKQEKIFERFFQNEIPGTMVNQGSGIGLSITKEFVRLHNGYISVQSEPDKGSRFTVFLPFGVEHTVENLLPYQPAVLPQPEPTVTVNETAVNQPVAAASHNKPVILLVEDNEDFRFYLKDNLKEFYHIVEAENGRIGWQRTLSAHPAIVVSDVSMPEMDGIELCKKIKQDARTRHIPVMLLTALIGEEQQLKGLQTGATDYITKPFSFEILVSRIRNILHEQEALKRTYSKQVEAKTSEIKVGSPDERFIQQALQIVEQNLSNASFSVEELSRGLCMSRVAVYKKIFSLTGKAPIEFIRSVRLQRAAQLLEKTEMNIAEVAYEVGFNNPKYFTKYFKAFFGQVPSVYVAEKRKQAGSNVKSQPE